jgi:hypothetical protein
MRKYCDYFFTTKCHKDKEVAKGIWSYKYSWHIRNEKGEELQNSYEHEDKEYYDSRQIAEQEAKEAIQDYYV